MSSTVIGQESRSEGRAIYRVRQFLRGLGASVTPAERAEVHDLLSPACAALFDRQPVDAQRHSFNVMATLRSQSEPVPAELAAAALLHDVGKTAAGDGGIRLWVRGPLVLLEAIAPSLAESWESSDPHAGWRYLIYVQHQHPALGAQMVHEAGGSELTCWLIANHQLANVDTSDERSALLRRLQWADNQN